MFERFPIEALRERDGALQEVDAGYALDDLKRYLDMSPREFVDWHGQKYDLTPVQDWNI